MDTQPHGGGGGGGSANGSPQQFCLRWHNHQTSLLSSLPLLLDQSHLTDVTLIAEGRNIKAHRVVLSACSTFFSELFRTLDGPSLYPVIVLPGASFPAVVALLTFMYSGEVNVYEEQISTLLSLAETLGIKGLADFSGNSHNKSTTPTSTDEASSSRESEIPSPPYPPHHHHPLHNQSAVPAIKMESPGELPTPHHLHHHQPSPSPFFPRPPSTSSSSAAAAAAAAFNFHSPLFPQALNLATNNNNSSSNGQNHNSAGKSADLFSRFLPQNEALWKMNEESETINRDNKSGPSGGSGCLEDRQSVNANNKNNSGTSIAGAGTAAGQAGSDDEKQQNSSTPKNETESAAVAANTSPKFNFDSNSNHLHHDSTAPSTPSSNPDEHRMQHQQSLNTCSSKKSASQENKRKKIDKIAENLRTQTASASASAAAAAAAAAASFNKHLLQSLKSFPPSSQSPLSQLHLFSKPPTATPVSSNQQPPPSFLAAHHFLTNESASKTPENLILESAHPSPGAASSSTCSPSPSSSSSATMAMVAAAAAAHHLGGVSPQQQHQQQQQQKPPTKLYATCFICNKQLSNQYNLRVHLETHQNVRYACTVCSHVSRSKDALRKHVSYRHPGTPSPCDPDTKRKRSKANLGQMIKQESAAATLLNDPTGSAMSQLIKQEIMNSDQQQQQQHTNQLLANLTSQGNSIVSIPSFLQQAASMQSAFSATKSMLFNTAQIATSMAPPTSQMSQTEGVCSSLSQPKDLSNNSVESSSSSNANGSKKLDNGSPERMDEGSNTVATGAEESKPNGSAL